MYTYVLATFLSVLLHLVVKQRECNGLILMKKKNNNKTDDPLFLFLARFGVPATAGKIGELLAT